MHVVVVVVVVAGGGEGLGVVVGRGTDRCVVVGVGGSEQTHSMFTQPQFSPSGRHWDAMHWPFAIVMNNSNATNNAMTKQNIFAALKFQSSSESSDANFF
jgi:hypothetical protein